MSNVPPIRPHASDDRVRLQVHIPAQLADELSALADEADRPLSREVRRALAAHVKREREQSTAHQRNEPPSSAKAEGGS